MAAEIAAQPIISIAEELPKRFRSWIEGLSVQTDGIIVPAPHD